MYIMYVKPHLGKGNGGGNQVLVVIGRGKSGFYYIT